jgi:hypothetical protein
VVVMLYSCFDDAQGVYHVFADHEQRAINSDLPVPKLGSDEGKIGVPSIAAARVLPANALYVGDSWHARGIVVKCPGQSLGDSETLKRAWSSFWPIAMVGAVGAWLWWAWRRMDWEEKRQRQ